MAYHQPIDYLPESINNDKSMLSIKENQIDMNIKLIKEKERAQ